MAKGREALLQYNLVLRLVPDFLPVGGSVSEHTLVDGAQAGFSCIVRGLGVLTGLGLSGLGSARL